MSSEEESHPNPSLQGSGSPRSVECQVEGHERRGPSMRGWRLETGASWSQLRWSGEAVERGRFSQSCGVSPLGLATSVDAHAVCALCPGFRELPGGFRTFGVALTARRQTWLTCWGRLEVLSWVRWVIGSQQSVRRVSILSRKKKKRSLFEVSGCRVKPQRLWGRRGFTRQPENSKRAHFRAPALQTPPKFHEKTPRERKKKENCGGGGKKARNFGRSGGRWGVPWREGSGGRVPGQGVWERGSCGGGSGARGRAEEMGKNSIIPSI